MKKFAKTALLAAVMTGAAVAETPPNMGSQKPEASLPFNVTKVAEFDSQGWRIAFLPDGRMLVTEKKGVVWLVTQSGQKTEIANAPKVLYDRQAGLLGIYLSPNYATDNFVYITYSEPGTAEQTSSLALARAKLTLGASPSLDGLQVIWRDPIKGKGGQFGAAVAFRDNLLYLSVGDRQRMTPAQDPNQPLGKILRLTLDGKPAPGYPNAGKTGGTSIAVIDPPADTEAAKTAPVVSTQTWPGTNLTPSETWATGFRTPYGIAFAPNGELWEIEHGPGGGDELNLIEPGKNYGWPNVSYGPNYNKVPIPSPDDHAEYVKPAVQWTPIIAPGNMVFYKGEPFKQWDGSALVSGMRSQSLTRITFDGEGGAKVAERWNLGFNVRDVAVAPDGAIWFSEGGLNNSLKGALYRATPK